MKKNLLQLSILLALVMTIGFQKGYAQDKKKSKVHITITEDDKVTTDTTFELSEDQDPEMIKKMVQTMATEDLETIHVIKEMHADHDGDHKMVWISEDSEHNTWTAEEMMGDINLDSIKEAHGGGKVMVMKNDEGEITVKELDDDEVIHMEDGKHGKHGEMMFIEEGEDGEIIHIKKMKKGGDVMMIHEHGDGEEKEIKVIVHADSDTEWEGKEKNIKVIVEGDEDGEEVKVVKKKVKVEVEVEEEEDEVKDKKKNKKKK